MRITLFITFLLFVVLQLRVLTPSVNAQNCDTVCMQQISRYWVNGSQNSTFHWTIQGGAITHGLGNDTIQVQWGSVSGLFSLNVIEENATGCYGDTLKLNIYIFTHTPLSISGPTDICSGDTVTLCGSNGSTLYWNTGDTSSCIHISPVNTTQYQLIGSSQCKTDTVLHLTTVHSLPVVDFTYFPTKPNIGDQLNFIYTGTSVTQWNWSDDTGIFSTIANPGYQYNSTQYITLWATDNFGCSDSIQKRITSSNEINIWIPNAFTPNGDGLNDLFKIETISQFYEFEFIIYNRWGQILFHSNNQQLGWDGTYQGIDVIPGNYVWVIKYKIQQNSALPIEKTRRGSVCLIR